MIKINKIEDKIKQCRVCHLYNSNPIFKPLPGSGEGEKFLIVGVAPSIKRIEMPSVDNSNPLVDDSRYTSSWLYKILKEVEWPIEESYVTNFIKCTLPDNRYPTPIDINTCVKLHFAQEVYTLLPQVIICLGNIVYDSLSTRNELKSFTFEKVYHYAYIARKPSEYNLWKDQWLNLKEKYL